MKQTLKGLRINMGLTAKEFAEKLEISEDVLYNYESGRTVPDVNFVDKLLKLTSLKYEDIIFCSKDTI